MVKKRKTTKKKTQKKKTTKKRIIKKKKVSAKRRISRPRITQTSTEIKVEKILIENFVALQKVLTNLSLKLDGVTTQISKLLNLFELSAKALAEKDFKIQKEEMEPKSDPKLTEKIDTLLNQNKIIARGLTMVHERPNTFTPSIQQNRTQRMPLNPPAPNHKPLSEITPPQKPLTAPKAIEQNEFPKLDEEITSETNSIPDEEKYDDFMDK